MATPPTNTAQPKAADDGSFFLDTSSAEKAAKSIVDQIEPSALDPQSTKIDYSQMMGLGKKIDAQRDDNNPAKKLMFDNLNPSIVLYDIFESLSHTGSQPIKGIGVAVEKAQLQTALQAALDQEVDPKILTKITTYLDDKKSYAVEHAKNEDAQEVKDDVAIIRSALQRADVNSDGHLTTIELLGALDKAKTTIATNHDYNRASVNFSL